MPSGAQSIASLKTPHQETTVPPSSSATNPRRPSRPGRSTNSDKADRQAVRDKVVAMRRQQKATERRRAALIWGGATATILAIVAVVTFAILQQRANTPSLDAVQTYTVEQGHVKTPVTYAQAPPAGGAHAPVWLNCGTYSKPVRNENAVHSMEHGAVWITYRPDLPPAQIAQLSQATPATYAVLSPYPGLPAPVVASAWGKQLTLTGPDDPRLAVFIRAYRQGPQTLEAGAACTGGTDGTDGTAPPVGPVAPGP